MNTLQQLQEEYENIYSPIIGTIWSTDSDSIQRYKQTMNYIEKAFKLGQLSGIELSEGCIPMHPTDEYAISGGYFINRNKDNIDNFREKSLTNLSDLKQKIQHEKV